MTAVQQLHHQEEEEDDDQIEVPSQFICSLTLQRMRDPVLSRYGHSYERSAIIEWLLKRPECPLTRQPLKLSDLITNYRLRSDIRRWAIEHEQPITMICDDPWLSSEAIFSYCFLECDETERSLDDEHPVEEMQPSRSRAGRRRRPSTSGASNSSSSTSVTRGRSFLRLFRPTSVTV